MPPPEMEKVALDSACVGESMTAHRSREAVMCSVTLGKEEIGKKEVRYHRTGSKGAPLQILVSPRPFLSSRRVVER